MRIPTCHNVRMATFVSDDIEIHFDEYGSGFPVLLIAPGGMKSEASFWESTPESNTAVKRPFPRDYHGSAERWAIKGPSQVTTDGRPIQRTSCRTSDTSGLNAFMWWECA